MTRPKASVAESKSSHVAPPCERAIPRVAIDLDASHPRDVDDEPAVEDTVPGGVVPPAAHGDLELVAAGEVERRRDVARPEATGDRRGPAVDKRVEAPARCVVTCVVRAEHVTRQRPPKLAHAPVDVRHFAAGS